MADADGAVVSGPRINKQALNAAFEQVERSILLWEEIESHLKDAIAQLEEMRATVRSFNPDVVHCRTPL
jgi:hypothetical protein